MRVFSIVGQNWLKTESILAALQPGAELVLVREPLNPVDPLAVAVWAGGIKIGYVPKSQNKALSAFIDQTGTMAHYSGAMDQVGAIDVQKSIPAKFTKSPNSGYPQVVVSE